MSADSYDNALAETINGLGKTEVIYRRRLWRGPRRGRIRHPGMVRLVQLPPTARADRQHLPGRETTGVLSPAERVGQGGLTITNGSPE